MARVCCLKTGWDYDNLSPIKAGIIAAYCNQLFINNGDESKALSILEEQINSFTFKFNQDEV